MTHLYKEEEETIKEDLVEDEVATMDEVEVNVMVKG